MFNKKSLEARIKKLEEDFENEKLLGAGLKSKIAMEIASKNREDLETLLNGLLLLIKGKKKHG